MRCITGLGPQLCLLLRACVRCRSLYTREDVRCACYRRVGGAIGITRIAEEYPRAMRVAIMVIWLAETESVPQRDASNMYATIDRSCATTTVSENTGRSNVQIQPRILVLQLAGLLQGAPNQAMIQLVKPYAGEAPHSEPSQKISLKV